MFYFSQVSLFVVSIVSQLSTGGKFAKLLSTNMYVADFVGLFGSSLDIGFITSRLAERNTDCRRCMLKLYNHYNNLLVKLS